MGLSFININSINKVKKEEVIDLSEILDNFLRVKPSDIDNNKLQSKPGFIVELRSFLQNLLYGGYSIDKKEKLRIIKFIDKLNEQEAALDLAIGNKKDFEIAGERLNQKSQSAFGTSKRKKKAG